MEHLAREPSQMEFPFDRPEPFIKETKNLYDILELLKIPNLVQLPMGVSEQAFATELVTWMKDPNNFVLTDGENIATFQKEREVTFQVHLVFKEGQRGKYALKTVKRMFDHMSKHHGAKAFIGAVPVKDKATKLFCRLLGGVGLNIIKDGQEEKQIFHLVWKEN